MLQTCLEDELCPLFNTNLSEIESMVGYFLKKKNRIDKADVYPELYHF